MKKIIISVTNDIVTDQRVLRAANTLSNAGHEILIVGRKKRDSLSGSHIPFKHKRFRLLFEKGPFFYFSFNIRLFFFLIFRKVNILLANDLDTLLPNFLISRLKGIPLVYDSHEYFTEVPELISRSRTRNIWLSIEKTILPKIQYTYTVSHSIADAYKKKYNIDMQVIRNLPETNFKNTPQVEIPGIIKDKIIIYQGALNTGRGLDIAINAMKSIPKTVLVIVGDGPEKKRLKELSAELYLNDRVLFLDRYLPSELRAVTKQADLGISLEENIGLSYKFALPNKLFDYIHAKVPVLVSSLPEMKAIVKNYDIGEVLESDDPIHVAEIVNSMLWNEEKIEEWKNNLEIAALELCWEKEEGKLLELFNRIQK